MRISFCIYAVSFTSNYYICCLRIELFLKEAYLINIRSTKSDSSSIVREYVECWWTAEEFFDCWQRIILPLT